MASNDALSAGSDASDLRLGRARRGQARRSFAAMAAAYGLGVFNDNFFKQAACLIAVYMNREGLQDLAVAIFTLPWLLCAAPAGWLADRFTKSRVVVMAKALEFVAMVCGGLGIVLINWPLIMVMTFVMALQSTIFSPALNGSIPELYPPDRVIKANATLKALIMVGNMVGIVLAGMALKQKQLIAGVDAGRVIVCVAVITMALIGFVVSLGARSGPAADRSARFPWSGPWNTLQVLWRIRRDRLLATVVIADAFVWFVAVLQILIVNAMGKHVFGFNEEQTSYLLVTELCGVALGGAAAGYFANGPRWQRIVVPGLMLLGGACLCIAGTLHLPEALQQYWVAFFLLLTGAAGGLLLVPMEAFFQVRPPVNRRGEVIAAANFAGFFGMALSAPANTALRAMLSPVLRFGAVGVVVIGVAVVMRSAMRQAACGEDSSE